MMMLILYYVFLIASTVLMVRNAFKHWQINNDFTLPIITFFMFYFTIAGAYIFPLDAYFGFKGEAIGLHYLPIFQKLFTVHFDADYFQACFYYVLFILVFQYLYYFFSLHILKNKAVIRNSNLSTVNYNVNPYLVLLLSCFLIFISFYILREEIFYAIGNEKSIYLTTRANKNPYYTIHQLANEFCVLIPFIAYAFSLLKNRQYNIGWDTKKNKHHILFLACLISSFYISFLGNRREILSGLVICVLICLNQFRTVNYKRFALIFSMVLIFFLSNSFFRSTIIPSKLNTVFHLEKSKVELKKEEFSVKGVAGSFIFSNELFYAHFSMYGSIHQHVPLTYGSSLVYLGSAVVPRAILPNRPPDIYTYYSKQVHAVEGQIYTLHHATAWYLNFGLVGILIGAIILALIFSFALWVQSHAFKSESSFILLTKYLISFLLCAQIVTFITAGPEAYKALIVEGLILPIVLLRCCLTKQPI